MYFPYLLRRIFWVVILGEKICFVSYFFYLCALFLKNFKNCSKISKKMSKVLIIGAVALGKWWFTNVRNTPKFFPKSCWLRAQNQNATELPLKLRRNTAEK